MHNGLRLLWPGHRPVRSPGIGETLGKEVAVPERRSLSASERTLAVILGLAIILLPLFAILGYGGWYASDQEIPRDMTTNYWYDPQDERWVSTVEEVKVSPNAGGSIPQGTHTIIINVDENNPVKQIIIDEALVINPSSSDPLLLIGSDNTSKINIGTLRFQTVDAERLEIDADVVDVELQDVVAKDDELHLDLDVVNVVRTARGAASSLFLGVGRTAILERLDLSVDLEEDVKISSKETGLRVDRIRILGPSSGTGFIETLIIARSSVQGEIDVRNVNIHSLIMKNVSLDDS